MENIVDEDEFDKGTHIKLRADNWSGRQAHQEVDMVTTHDKLKKGSRKEKWEDVVGLTMTYL